MSNSTKTSDERQYPFGLSSRQLFFLVVVVGLIGPGFAVNILDRANLRLLSDIVWVVGYGSTIFVLWFIWIRPLDLVGPSGLDISQTHGDENEEAETDDKPSEAESTMDDENRQGAET